MNIDQDFENVVHGFFKVSSLIALSRSLHLSSISIDGMGGGNPTTGAPVSTSSGPSDRLFGLECPIHPELSQTIRSALSSLKVGLEFCLAITVSANHIRDAPLETWLLKWIPHRSHPHSVMPTHQNVWAAFLRSLYTELRLLPCFGLFRSNKKRPEEALVFDLQISIKTFPASTSLSYFFSFCDQFPFRPISCLRGMFHLEVGYLSQHHVQQLFHRTPPAPPALPCPFPFQTWHWHFAALIL